MENNVIEDLLYNAGLTAQGCWDELDDYARDAIIRVIKMTVNECIDIAYQEGDNVAYLALHFGVNK